MLPSMSKICEIMTEDWNAQSFSITVTVLEDTIKIDWKNLNNSKLQIFIHNHSFKNEKIFDQVLYRIHWKL